MFFSLNHSPGAVAVRSKENRTASGLSLEFVAQIRQPPKKGIVLAKITHELSIAARVC